ncbi:probable serine/threonine-protein kinase DDB_G0277071 isoform X2 [Ornithodoros turicata]|uniref:probable serine/threonine-protein kinase DDB_G0277071 isoform X2 n=1 Tax=Ornithodoros turicata TaxID=34597 RepID=UPI003138ED1E
MKGSGHRHGSVASLYFSFPESSTLSLYDCESEMSENATLTPTVQSEITEPRRFSSSWYLALGATSILGAGILLGYFVFGGPTSPVAGLELVENGNSDNSLGIPAAFSVDVSNKNGSDVTPLMRRPANKRFREPIDKYGRRRDSKKNRNRATAVSLHAVTTAKDNTDITTEERSETASETSELGRDAIPTEAQRDMEHPKIKKAVKTSTSRIIPVITALSTRTTLTAAQLIRTSIRIAQSTRKTRRVSKISRKAHKATKMARTRFTLTPRSSTSRSRTKASTAPSIRTSGASPKSVRIPGARQFTSRLTVTKKKETSATKPPAPTKTHRSILSMTTTKSNKSTARTTATQAFYTTSTSMTSSNVGRVPLVSYKPPRPPPPTKKRRNRKRPRPAAKKDGTTRSTLTTPSARTSSSRTTVLTTSSTPTPAKKYAIVKRRRKLKHLPKMLHVQADMIGDQSDITNTDETQ